MVNLIFITIGLLCSLWFLCPFFTKRILNIGNLTGLLWSIALIFCGINIKKTYTKNLLIFLCICFICAFLGLLLILRACNQRANTQAPCTVVLLGCRVYGTEASLMLEERIFAAYHYLVQNPRAVCICTGGKGSDEDISEALCAQEYLLSLGIAKERLFLESASISTYENLSFAKEIITNSHLPEDIAIATNEFHEYRAIRTAKQLGFSPVFALPAHTAWWLFPTYFVRELYAIIYYWLRKK